MNIPTRQILPGDTLGIDLISSISIILIGLAVTTGFYDVTPSINQFHHPIFWGIVGIALGALYLISLIIESCPLRVFLAWITGTFWVYISFSLFEHHRVEPMIPLFLLGIGCLYSSVLNFLINK